MARQTNSTAPDKPIITYTETTDPFIKRRVGWQASTNNFAINEPKKDIHRDLEWGWMLETLLLFDDLYWGRWEYWALLQLSQDLPDTPIPRIEFLGTQHPQVRKMLGRTLDEIQGYGRDHWMGWSNYEYFNYFLDWVLYGLGWHDQKELPREPMGCTGASDRIYQVFNLGAMSLYPYDYLGSMLAECAHGRHNGFFPTPHYVVEMMCEMVTVPDLKDQGGDMRLKTVCDPCVGTGRFPLHMSNHCFDIACMDKDLTVLKCAIVNGYFYAPWLVRPLYHTKRWREEEAARLANLKPPGTETETPPAPQEPPSEANQAFVEEIVRPALAIADLFEPLIASALIPERASVKRAKKAVVSVHQNSLFDLLEEEE